MNTTTDTDSTSASDELSFLIIKLMKGVMYIGDDSTLWQNLLKLQTQVRDYVRMIGLDLILSEDEGVAWLTSRNFEEGETALPRLINKRPLSFPVSLLLALLRRKLVEHDASSGESRLIVTREELIDNLRIFIPLGSNEARFMDQMNHHINKTIELGFVRQLKSDNEKLEIMRIIKAFVDAQWLGEFENKLQAYIEYSNGLNEIEE